MHEKRYVKELEDRMAELLLEKNQVLTENSQLREENSQLR
jgi:hypothetical protein